MNPKMVIVIIMVILACLINRSRIAKLNKQKQFEIRWHSLSWDCNTCTHTDIHTHIHIYGGRVEWERECQTDHCMNYISFPFQKEFTDLGEKDYWLRGEKNVQVQGVATQWQVKHSKIATCIHSLMESGEIKWNKNKFLIPPPH